MKRSPSNATLVALAVIASLGAAGIAVGQEAKPAAGPTGLIAKRCQAEVTNLCPGVEAGGGKLAKCLRGHEAELSEPCKAALAAGFRGPRTGTPVTTMPAAVPVAAERPAVAPTPAPPPAPGAAGQPPKAGQAEAPRPRTGAGMNAPSAWGPMAGMRRTCSAEIVKLCRDVKPGHGRLAICLSEHPQELSPPCKASVEQVMNEMGAPLETHRACADDVKRLCGDVPPRTGRAAFCLGEHAAELSPDCKKQVAEMKDGWGRRSFGPQKGMGRGPAPAPTSPAAAPGAPPPSPARPAAAPPPSPARAPLPPPPPAPQK